MKKLLFLLCFAPLSLLAQVTWSFSSQPLGNDEFNIVFKATIEEGWYVYSQYLPATEGASPVPTSFTYDPEAGKTFKLVGKNIETGAHKIELDDPLFDNLHITKFGAKTVTFTQKVKVLDYKQPITGYLTFMTCNDKTCKPPRDIDFSFKLEPSGTTATTDNTTQPEQTSTTNTTDTAKTGNPITTTTTATPSGDPQVFHARRPSINVDAPVSNCGEVKTTEEEGLFGKFLLGFLGGLFAVLMPCLYPLIPMTVSYFTGRGRVPRAEAIKNAMIYGASIVGIYVVFSFLFTLAFGQAGLNTLSTHWIPNVLFFIVFLVFAVSFLGYFEITLPSSWTTRTESASNTNSGIGGIFFMAFTLVLVTFSCTGPIAAGLLATVSTSPLASIVGMGGFGLALALPFTLFAMFPAWLNSMPKSGGWMNDVKVFLAFIEIALAFKFFSTADLTMHWGILKYEIFMGIWTLCALGFALYCFNILKFKYGAKSPLPRNRIIAGVLSLALSGWLGSGLIPYYSEHTYHPPSFVTGLAPSTGYSILFPNECPLDIPCFHDYEEGLKYAKEQKKMVFIDFTGYGCVNCRKMEEETWKRPEILRYLQNDVVMISLYVDDRAKLDQVMLDEQGNKLRTVGSLWAAFEEQNFKYNAQPYYCLLSPDEVLLNNPVGYCGVQEFKAFLTCGFDALRQVRPDCHQPNY